MRLDSFLYCYPNSQYYLMGERAISKLIENSNKAEFKFLVQYTALPATMPDQCQGGFNYRL